MQLREKLIKLNRFEHEAHVTSLSLVVIGVLAGWLQTQLALHFDIGPAIAKLLHWLHYLSIGLVFVYAIIRLLFSRRPSREISKLIPKPRLSQPGSIYASLPKAPKAYKYRGRPIPPDDREFVTDPNGPLASVLFEMNLTAYEGSSFELTFDEVKQRNTSIIKCNHVAFMLFRDPNRETTTPVENSTIDDFVGYTAVFPLNQIGKDLYLRGLIPDRRFPESLLCQNGEETAMLLLFALHLRKPYSIKAAGLKYSLLLVRCIEEHIRIAAHAHADVGDQIEVWVQSDDKDIRDHYPYRGFNPSSLKSNEGFPLYCRSIIVS